MNPFWSYRVPGGLPPLHPADPKLEIVLAPFVGRLRHEHMRVAITSADRVLFRGEMINGRIEAKIDLDVAQLPDWKAPLAIREEIDLTYNSCTSC